MPTTRKLGGPGYELVERSLATIKRYGMVEPQDKVLVAVSGGPDSTCLLDVLARLSGVLELSLEVAHVDHGLSEASAEVAALVAHSGAAAGFDVHVGRAPDLTGPNLHARAREFRYGFFATVAEQIGATHIATGHTLDDRVETTLARLIHGAGTEGLAGLPPVEEPRIRPLVESRRTQTRAYCHERSLEFYDDPANVDPRFDRSEVRSVVLAAIEERWGEGAVRAMASSADRLSEDAAALTALADKLFGDLAKSTEAGVRFDLDLLTALPRALRRRVLERAVGRIRDRSGGIEAALDALDAGHKPGARFAVASGIEIVIASDHVLVSGMIST